MNDRLGTFFYGVVIDAVPPQCHSGLQSRVPENFQSLPMFEQASLRRQIAATSTNTVVMRDIQMRAPPAATRHNQHEFILRPRISLFLLFLITRMTHKLADEILKEILAPPLSVTDDLFCNTDDISPFSRVDSSASDVLLVCKRWMRVATPCLYETVVIRSTAQAHALSAALTRNPQFGAYVRRFRIENTYAAYLGAKDIATMFNIRELLLTLAVLGADRPTDLYALLANPNIEHILVGDFGRSISNPTRRKLVSKISEVAATWKNLKRVTTNHSIWEELGEKFWGTLATCRTLHTIEIARSWTPDDSSYQRVLTNPSLRHLVFRIDKGFFSGQDLKGWPTSANCRVSVKKLSSSTSWFVSDADPSGLSGGFSTAPNPFWTPMASADVKTRIAIWTRVLGFAVVKTAGNPYRHNNPEWVDRNRMWLDTARRTVFLSKELSIATIRALSQHLSPSHGSELHSLCSVMERDPTVRKIPQTLYMAHVTVTPNDGDHILSFFKLLQHLKSAVFFGDWIGQLDSATWLTAIGPSVGHSLLRLELVLEKPHRRWGKPPGDVGKGATLNPVAVFGDLQALEELKWSFEPLHFSAASIPKNSTGLARLKKLHVSKAHQSFFNFLAQISLPALEEFDLAQGIKAARKFLQKNGGAIRKFTVPDAAIQADFDMLPRVEELKLTESNQAKFFSSISCPSVIKLACTWNTDRNSRTNWLSDYYEPSFDLLVSHTKRFPKLREIWVPSSDIWPTTEREEKKNHWIPYSDNLATINVALKDANGRPWRRRLKIE
ncbi:hypothetical protein BKA62DRAFT_451495 [Auriculariales sp. MPI-PUGE-AT-0066]|nr:hypothetical protein BKA62DRAFT_451495 [Auriculariales sp. MPI-PUGE-AT-0066]